MKACSHPLRRQAARWAPFVIAVTMAAAAAAPPYPSPGLLTPDASTSSPAAGAPLPPTAPGHVWNFTRQTRSAFVTANVWDWYARKQVSEREKFIFYRGLGRFDPLLRVQSGTEGRVTLA